MYGRFGFLFLYFYCLYHHLIQLLQDKWSPAGEEALMKNNERATKEKRSDESLPQTPKISFFVCVSGQQTGKYTVLGHTPLYCKL